MNSKLEEARGGSQEGFADGLGRFVARSNNFTAEP